MIDLVFFFVGLLFDVSSALLLFVVDVEDREGTEDSCNVDTEDESDAAGGCDGGAGDTSPIQGKTAAGATAEGIAIVQQ